MDKAALEQVLGTRPFRFFPSTASTMQAARDWLREQPDLPGGAVVIADEQTRGKGRLKRAWLTPPGTAIAMSVILRGGHAHLTILGGVTVALVLDSYAPGVNIKWPNDVQIGAKKVCGILAESIWDGDKPTASILGIGINIAVDFGDSELTRKAANLTDYAIRPVDRPAIIAAVLGQIDIWLGASPDELHRAWKKRLSTLGQRVTVFHDNRQTEGIAVDVDSDGALLVESGGTIQRFLAGDVSLSGA